MLKEIKRGQGGEQNSRSCLVNLDVFFWPNPNYYNGGSDKTLLLLILLLPNGFLQDTHSF